MSQKQPKPADPQTPEEIEQFLLEKFEENFERLRAESGHTLSPEVKKAAKQQVLMYWRKLRHIAEGITETEVKLNLANQVSPKGRRFCIEGIVDIVREADRTTMYDLKTHDLEFVRSNCALYQKQLNVYAHIWQNLRGERLDETAVISTTVPKAVRDAVESGDQQALADAMAAWDPVVPIPFDARQVQGTIDEFAKAVDAIEDGDFAPPSASTLRRREVKNESFAQRYCLNCDARFSCGSFREYASAPERGNARNLLPFFDSIVSEEEREEWLAESAQSAAANEFIRLE